MEPLQFVIFVKFVFILHFKRSDQHYQIGYIKIKLGVFNISLLLLILFEDLFVRTYDLLYPNIRVKHCFVYNQL